MPGGGDFVTFFWTKNIIGQGVSPGGGTVTGQIDTCITSTLGENLCVLLVN